MCTSFIKKGKDTVVGFNFDADTAVWQHKLILEPDKFYIVIKYKGKFMPAHGVNSNGTVANELYVPECEAGKYRRSPSCQRLDLLIGQLINGQKSFADAVKLAQEKNILNVPSVSLHSHITNKDGDVLIIEPGRGVKTLTADYSVMTNFALFDVDGTKDSLGAGYDRYTKATEILNNASDDFSLLDGLKLLNAVRQEGEWATRVSFVYSANENKVLYTLNNDFENCKTHSFL